MEFNSWSLYFAHRFDPLTFARELWAAFDVQVASKTGALVEERDPVKFVHTNMTQHGCIDDPLLTPRTPFSFARAFDPPPIK